MFEWRSHKARQNIHTIANIKIFFHENHSAEVIFDEYINIHHHADKQWLRKNHRGCILCLSSYALLAADKMFLQLCFSKKQIKSFSQWCGLIRSLSIVYVQYQARAIGVQSLEKFEQEVGLDLSNKAQCIFRQFRNLLIFLPVTETHSPGNASGVLCQHAPLVLMKWASCYLLRIQAGSCRENSRLCIRYWVY